MMQHFAGDGRESNVKWQVTVYLVKGLQQCTCSDFITKHFIAENKEGCGIVGGGAHETK